MKTSCPACGAAFSLDALIAHDGAREAVMAALAIPANIGKPLVMYLALFRPPKRSLSYERVAGLLKVLLPMIEAGKITRNGRIWSAPQEYWHMALAEMITKRDKLTLPLKSHGYLLAIIEGYGNKAEAKAEAQQEDRKAGRTPIGGNSAPVRTEPATGSPHSGGAPTGVPLAGAVEVAAKPRSVMPESVKAELKKLNLTTREYNAGDRYE